MLSHNGNSKWFLKSHNTLPINLIEPFVLDSIFQSHITKPLKELPQIQLFLNFFKFIESLGR